MLVLSDFLTTITHAMTRGGTFTLLYLCLNSLIELDKFFFFFFCSGLDNLIFKWMFGLRKKNIIIHLPTKIFKIFGVIFSK